VRGPTLTPRGFFCPHFSAFFFKTVLAIFKAAITLSSKQHFAALFLWCGKCCLKCSPQTKGQRNGHSKEGSSCQESSSCQEGCKEACEEGGEKGSREESRRQEACEEGEEVRLVA